MFNNAKGHATHSNLNKTLIASDSQNPYDAGKSYG